MFAPCWNVVRAFLWPNAWCQPWVLRPVLGQVSEEYNPVRWKHQCVHSQHYRMQEKKEWTRGSTITIDIYSNEIVIKITPRISKTIIIAKHNNPYYFQNYNYKWYNKSHHYHHHFSATACNHTIAIAIAIAITMHYNKNHDYYMIIIMIITIKIYSFKCIRLCDLFRRNYIKDYCAFLFTALVIIII